MSITYDPQKWSNPFHADEMDLPVSKPPSPVIVSVRDLRYFKPGQDLKNDSFGIFLHVDNDVIESARTLDLPDDQK